MDYPYELRRNDYETLLPGLRDAGVRLTEMVGDDARWVADYAFRHATDVARVWAPD